METLNKKNVLKDVFFTFRSSFFIFLCNFAPIYQNKTKYDARNIYTWP